jgi:hypothetical protein
VSEIFWYFLKLGWLAFGGPIGQIGLMHLEVVERRRWLSQDEFVRALNFCHLLPGPEALQLAIYIGYKRGGYLAGVLAGVLFVVPGFVTLTALAWIYVHFGKTPHVLGVPAEPAAAIVEAEQADVAVAYPRACGRHVGLPQLQQQLKLTYVTSGRCRVMGDTVQVSVELAHASSASVVWTGIVEGKKGDVLMVDGALGARIAEAITAAIFDFELKRSRSQPLPTLASHTLLFSAVALMHRLSKNDFDRARTLLEHLCERHPRAPEPHAWFAKWHVMKAVQGRVSVSPLPPRNRAAPPVGST